MRIILLVIGLLGVQGFADELTFNPEWVKSVARCKVKKPKGKVLIFKQWHLSPSAMTTDVPASQKLPQAKNQQAIYLQIADWATNAPAAVVIAEGCEGEIKEGFKTAYNGWTIESLSKAASTPEYSSIVTHVPLKIEAQFKDKVSTWCGDNNELVKKHSLVFSDLRGLLGYKTRLAQFKDQPEKAKPYLESFIKINKLAANTKVNHALEQIQSQLKSKEKELKALFAERNQTFVQAVQKHGGAESALVIGGLHAEDLKNRLEKAQYDCEVLEPAGYVNEDEKLFSDLEKSIQ